MAPSVSASLVLLVLILLQCQLQINGEDRSCAPADFINFVNALHGSEIGSGSGSSSDGAAASTVTDSTVAAIFNSSCYIDLTRETCPIGSSCDEFLLAVAILGEYNEHSALCIIRAVGGPFENVVQFSESCISIPTMAPTVSFTSSQMPTASSTTTTTTSGAVINSSDNQDGFFSIDSTLMIIIVVIVVVMILAASHHYVYGRKIGGAYLETVSEHAHAGGATAVQNMAWSRTDMELEDLTNRSTLPAAVRYGRSQPLPLSAWEDIPEADDDAPMIDNRNAVTSFSLSPQSSPGRRTSVAMAPKLGEDVLDRNLKSKLQSGVISRWEARQIAARHEAAVAAGMEEDTEPDPLVLPNYMGTDNLVEVEDLMKTQKSRLSLLRNKFIREEITQFEYEAMAQVIKRENTV